MQGPRLWLRSCLKLQVSRAPASPPCDISGQGLTCPPAKKPSREAVVLSSCFGVRPTLTEVHIFLPRGFQAKRCRSSHRESHSKCQRGIQMPERGRASLLFCDVSSASHNPADSVLQPCGDPVHTVWTKNAYRVHADECTLGMDHLHSRLCLCCYLALNLTTYVFNYWPLSSLGITREVNDKLKLCREGEEY